MGVTLGALPVSNLVLIEVGLAIGLILLAIDQKLRYEAGGVLALAIIFAFLRWSGRWFTQWVGLTLQYTFRSHTKVANPLPPTADEQVGVEEATVLGPDDPRVNLLRLVVPDLIVAHGTDHERRQVGLAWHEGAWTAVLLVDPAPNLITPLGATPSLPLGALAPCLEDRGVVLDAIQVIWHCYPGSAALPMSSPALASYLEVLGPLPAAAAPHHVGRGSAGPEPLPGRDRRTWRWRRRFAPRADRRPVPGAQRAGGARRADPPAGPGRVAALGRVGGRTGRWHALEQPRRPQRELDRRDRGRHRPRQLRDHPLAARVAT